MKGTVIVLGATFIAAVIASTESPSPDSPKVEANPNSDLRRPADAPAQHNKPSEPSSTAVEMTNIAPPTVTPSATAIPERISEK